MKEEIKEIKKEYISIDDFAKVEIKLGTVLYVKEVEGSDKLYQLTVDFGEKEIQEENEDGRVIQKEKLKYRNVMSGIKKYKSIDDLVGRQFPFVTNLAPRKMMGKYVSEAMILAASAPSSSEPKTDSESIDDIFSLFPTETKLPNGTLLR